MPRDVDALDELARLLVDDHARRAQVVRQLQEHVQGLPDLRDELLGVVDTRESIAARRRGRAPRVRRRSRVRSRLPDAGALRELERTEHVGGEDLVAKKPDLGLENPRRCLRRTRTACVTFGGVDGQSAARRSPRPAAGPTVELAAKRPTSSQSYAKRWLQALGQRRAVCCG